MKWTSSLIAVAALAGNCIAQEAKKDPAPAPAVSPAPLPQDIGEQRPLYLDAPDNRVRLLSGNHNFDDFIGFMSNPSLNVDPRAVTELSPIWGVTRISGTRVLPGVTVWPMPGAAINVALGERLSMGINQGGFVAARFNKDTGLLQYSGERQGWLDLGGFVQYTAIQNVERQFLLTTGLRWIAPIGSSAIFQGSGPVQLAPYVTIGKGLGEFHILATAGYQFDVGPNASSQQFYGSLHLDRRVFGWLYPLVEFNWVAQAKNIDLGITTTNHGYLDFGSYTATGNLVSLAVGANAVIVANKLEFGAVYTTPIYSQNNLNFNGFLLRMTLRY